MDLLNSLFALSSRAEEYVYMIAFNRKRPIAIFEISHGVVDKALLRPREIYIRALLCGATGIIVAHNHPSQDTTPSQDDINVALKLHTAGQLLGIVFLVYCIDDI